MSKAVDWLRQGLYIGLIGILFGVVCVEFKSICKAADRLLEKTQTASSLEFAGIKMTFNAAMVSAAFDSLALDEAVTPAKRAVTLDRIHGLNQAEFVRLMSVGQLDATCEYGAPNTKMRFDVATDYSLVDKELVEMIDSADLLERTKQYAAAAIGRGDKWTIGRPSNCYLLTLTELGANVKSALVGSFGSAFGNPKRNSAPLEMRVAER
jgi:hypothetical protein